jgi:hypothetical protein
MSSAIHRDIKAGERLTNVVGQQSLVAEQMRRVGLSQRQLELNRLYAYARTQQHDNCMLDWDGSQHATSLDREAITSTAQLPQGYQDPGGNLQTLPLRYRRPSVPCHLGKVIPARFTGLLFSEQQHPQWKVAGSPQTEAWLEAVSKTYGLWAKMTLVRDLGGAMGTTLVGFKVIEGRVIFEEFDPRWCFPTFDPRNPGKLKMLEVRFMYPQEIMDRDTGAWREEKFWYRRIIDTEVDCLWKPQLVGDGSKEPDWKNPETVEEVVTHNFGVVPIEWIPNIEVTNDIDGDPDCHGCYDYFDRIGELDSQVHKGAVRNADPTAVLASDFAFNSIQLGSDTAVKVEKGGGLNYAESQGTAVEAAAKESERLEKKALRVAECVLPEEDATDKGPVTATEINKRTSAMHAKASRMRQQYGAKGLVPLMEKLIKAARKLGQATVGTDAAGQPSIVRQAILLPPKMEGEKKGTYALDEDQNAQIELVWPPFSLPTPEETVQVANATVALRNAQIISMRTATRKVAPHYDIEDVDAEVEQAKKDAPAAPANLAEQSLDELNQGR